MPYKRQENKFVSRGLCLTQPADLLKETQPYLLNMRQYYMGAFQNRPGLDAINAAALADLTVHSIIRLNNYIYDTYSRFLGAGDELYSNGASPGIFISRANGFSGKPLQFSVMRPRQSPESWLYIGDSLKSGKARVDGTFYNQGIAPPTVAPYVQPAATSIKIISDFEATTGWTTGGTAGAVSVPDRISTTIAKIVYDTGSTGWATVQPTTLDEAIQPGMLLIFNASETVLVESVSEAVTTTTISSIQYDSGTTGACTIQLAAPTDGLARDSMLRLDSGGAGDEVVRMLSVTWGPGGLPSLRCVTVNAQSATKTVTGARSFRAFTTGAFSATQTLTSKNLESSITVGIGYISLTSALDLTSVNSRPITDNDIIHISIKVSDLALLTEGRIAFDVDSGTNDFTQNYYYWPFRANDLVPATVSAITTLAAQQRIIQRDQIESTYYVPNLQTKLLGYYLPEDLIAHDYSPTAPMISSPSQTTLGASQWTELRVRVGDLVRVGSDTSRSLHDIAAIRIQLQTTGTVTLDVDAWWVGGTYGQSSDLDTGIGAPYNYIYVYRSQLTGAQSQPSPPMREGIMVHRQSVAGTVTASSDPQVNMIDIYRTGGALIVADNSSPWFYVMSVSNSSPAFVDNFPDDVVIRARQIDFDNYQPFLDVDVPRSGTCSVVGTEVTRIGGDVFNVAWPAGVTIIINNVPYSLFTQPSSTTKLSLVQSAGTQTNVDWFIAGPRLMAQPMPSMWGPFGGGTFEPVLFACGSTYQPGRIFWTRPGDADANSQFGSLELTSPSEPLINGVVFRSQAYAFSSEALYILTPTIMAGELRFSGAKVAGNRGLFARNMLCVGDEGIFYGSRDGIYLTVGGESISLTDEMLYPLFTHEGAPPVTTNGIAPPDFCDEDSLRLIYGESCVYFDFRDINGNRATLMYDIKLKGWFYYRYTPGIVVHYFEEGANLNTMVLGGSNGKLYLSSGDNDDGTAIDCRVWTNWFDGEDPRGNKQWANGMLDFKGCGVLVKTFVDFATLQIGSQTLNSGGCVPDTATAAWQIPALVWTAVGTVVTPTIGQADWTLP